MVLRRASSARGRDIVMPQPDTIVPPRSPSKPALRTRRRHTSLDNCTTHGALAARKTWRLSRDRRLRFGAARARRPALGKIKGWQSLRAGRIPSTFTAASRQREAVLFKHQWIGTFRWAWEVRLDRRGALRTVGSFRQNKEHKTQSVCVSTIYCSNCTCYFALN